MYNSRYQKEAEKAVIDCRKTLFECALQLEQLKMSENIAKAYIADRVISEDVNLTIAIRMQEALEDKYYTEEGGIFSTIWTTIKEMFKKLRNWLFGESAPSTKPSDYSVKEVKSDKPVDIKGINAAMKDIEKMTKDLKNTDDPEKVEAAANSIKDKLSEALKPTSGKVAGLVSIAMLIGIFKAGQIALRNAEKNMASLESDLRCVDLDKEEIDKITKKMVAHNKLVGALVDIQKFTTSLLKKATGKKVVKLDDDFINGENDVMHNAIRRDWFMWKFRYACTDQDVGKISKNINSDIFPPNLRQEMMKKEELTASDIKKIGRSLGVDIKLLPNNYKEIVEKAHADWKRTRHQYRDEGAEIPRQYLLIPDSWWTSKNPYRISIAEMYKLQNACDSIDESNLCIREYGRAIGFVPCDQQPLPYDIPRTAVMDSVEW